MEELIMKNPEVKINSGDEIVIVVPENIEDDELVIDLEELGIDVENLDENVNIVIQVEGVEDIIDDEKFIEEPNEWYYDDDPYRIVYYEFVGDDD